MFVVFRFFDSCWWAAVDKSSTPYCPVNKYYHDDVLVSHCEEVPTMPPSRPGPERLLLCVFSEQSSSAKRKI